MFTTFRWLVCVCLAFATMSIPLGMAQDKASPLISATELVQLLEHSNPEILANLVILDVREAKGYEMGHLPKAVSLDINNWKNATKGNLEEQEFWSQELTRIGLRKDSQVVVYGAPLPEAARAWWLLKFAGVEQVQVLDGGLEAFEKAGGKLTTEPYLPKPGNFTPSFQRQRWISAEDLLKESIQSKTCQLIDNRTKAEYTGEEVRGARGGHVPGAYHSDWQQYLQSDGTMKPREELRKLLQDAGLDLQRPMATHCQSGGRSSVGALVVEYVTGQPARNYYRSWAEWAANDELPVEK